MVIPGSPNPSTLQLLVGIAQDYSLSQVVNEPTCLQNILDLFFFTNFPALVQNITVFTGLSDNDAVMITSKTKSPTYKLTQQKVPLYNRANWQAIIMNMQQLEHDISNLITMLPSTSTNCGKDSTILYKTYSLNISHTRLPWIQPHLRRQIKREIDYTDKPND